MPYHRARRWRNERRRQKEEWMNGFLAAESKRENKTERKESQCCYEQAGGGEG